MRDQGASVSKPGELFWRSWKDGTISLYFDIGHSGNGNFMFYLFFKTKPQVMLKADRNAITINVALGYRDAVGRFGRPELHRLYIVENASHIDAHSDAVSAWCERISSAQ